MASAIAVAPVVLLLAALLAWRGLRHAPPGAKASLEVLDVAALASGGARQLEALQALDRSLRTTGMARLRSHGADVAAARAAARAYFALPPRHKDCRGCSARNLSTGYQRGYIPFAAESGLAGVQEVKEGFCYGFEWPEDRPATHAYQTPNFWPENADEELGVEWRGQMMSFFNATIAVSQAVAAAAGELLNERASLEALMEHGETISQMRLFHYLPAEDSNGSVMGSSPHTDWHLLTIISRDDASSFQYLDTDTNEWLDADIAPDELLLLGGDWLSMFSKGRYLSAAHRVLSPERESSLSFVLFFYPSADARLPAGSAPPMKHGVPVNTVDDSMLRLPWGEYVVQMWAKVMSNR